MANIYGYSSLDEALSVLEENYNKEFKKRLKEFGVIYMNEKARLKLMCITKEDIAKAVKEYYNNLHK